MDVDLGCLRWSLAIQADGFGELVERRNLIRMRSAATADDPS